VSNNEPTTDSGRRPRVDQFHSPAG
jgi:hypothetical protein